MLTSEIYRCYSDVKVRLLQTKNENLNRVNIVKITERGAWYFPLHEGRDVEMKQYMKKGSVWLVLAVFLFAGGVFLLQNVYTPLKVNGVSMSPTLKNEQYVVVNRLAYDKKEADYKDIVIASNTSDTHGYIVKRVVGKPGDKIEFRNNQLYRNGVAVKNIVLPADTEETPEDTLVPAGEYYLMGDNIPESVDSRIMGTFATADIFGKVIYK